DENDLPSAFAQQRKHGLNHEVMAADVRTVHQIKISKRSLRQSSVENGAAAEYQNIHSAKIFLTAAAETANVFVVGEIGGTRVAAGAQRMDLLGKIFEEFAASRHQANLGAVRCNREGNRFADAAACASHHSNLILETFH